LIIEITAWRCLLSHRLAASGSHLPQIPRLSPAQTGASAGAHLRTGPVRADSAYYSAAFAGAVRAAGRSSPSPRRWTRTSLRRSQPSARTDGRHPLPRAIWDDHLGCRVSDAEGAEAGYTAFIRKKGQEITARLRVRRIRDLNKQAAGQDELSLVWRYHAVFTDSPFTLLQAKAQHRGHATAARVLADWTDGALAHLPSGSFPANAAWLVLAAIVHNLLRAAGSLANLAHAKGRGATLRRDLIDVAARTAGHGRGHITMRLPEGSHREHEWMNLFTAACGPPPATAWPARTRSPHPHRLTAPRPSRQRQNTDKPHEQSAAIQPCPTGGQ
jgi:hypothetical protein